ncbi:MAG: Acetylornithine aminotransferase [Thermoleophilia bacterium]|nr:Acetylornithine aminotransferase [Thermoleophilia bacterium]
MTDGGFELPGFRVAGAPVFNYALGPDMGIGEHPDVTVMLDLAMVFGSRLWGHDVYLDSVEQHAPGLGDLYAHELRDQANAALCTRVAGELGEAPDAWRALVLHTGSEAVETGIKTSLRATGRSRLMAFEGGYHGTSGMALAVTHGEQFREPWAKQLPSTVRWSPWGEVPRLTRAVAAVVVEPWQGRAGVIAPPEGFLAALREECDRVGALLVLDAVMCGAGRTGPTIAETLTEARPDVICLGKAIGCGLAASAVVVRAEHAVAAWEHGPVEPAHTSSTLGDPFACLGILRALELLETRAGEIDAASGAWRGSLTSLAADANLRLRGTGLLWALDTGVAGRGVELAWRLRDEHRILVVPSGLDGASITLYPPATGIDLERERFVDAVLAVQR